MPPRGHPHHCAAHGHIVVGGTCSTCDLDLEPAERIPPAPHGFLVCQHTGNVMLACPLGIGLAEAATE